MFDRGPRIRRGQRDVGDRVIGRGTAGQWGIRCGLEQFDVTAIPGVEEQDPPLSGAELRHGLHAQDLLVQPKRCVPVPRLDGHVMGSASGNQLVSVAYRHECSLQVFSVRGLQRTWFGLPRGSVCRVVRPTASVWSDRMI